MCKQHVRLGTIGIWCAAAAKDIAMRNWIVRLGRDWHVVRMLGNVTSGGQACTMRHGYDWRMVRMLGNDTSRAQVCTVRLGCDWHMVRMLGNITSSA